MASTGSLPSLRSASRREVYHHNAVLLHDADQKYDADNGNNIQLCAEEHQR